MTGIQTRQISWLTHSDVKGLTSQSTQVTALYPGPSPHAAGAEVVRLQVYAHGYELEQDHSISPLDWAPGLMISHMIAGGWPATV